MCGVGVGADSRMHYQILLFGASISPEAKTVSIQQFENVSTMVVPILATQLTEGLQDKFSRGTPLIQVREDGDLAFEGEITNYVSNPISVSGNEYATQNRLTVTVRVRFTNRIEPQYDFDRTFSAYEDYDAMKLMQEGGVHASARDSGEALRGYIQCRGIQLVVLWTVGCLRIWLWGVAKRSLITTR